MRTCSTCKQTKLESEFHRGSYGIGYRSDCIECYRQKRRNEYYANREQRIAYSKGYYEANKEDVPAVQAAWRERNREKLAIKQANRRANQLRATPSWTDLEKIGFVYKKAQQYGFEVDHIVPLNSKVVCGFHSWDNLQLMIRDENTRKNNRHWPDMP